MKADIQELVKERILVLDGAMGTMIQGFHLSEEDFRGEQFREYRGILKGNNDLLNLTCPEVIRTIHRRYLEAGADIITTNTFNSQRISMQDYGLEAFCRAMNLQGARLARALADEYTAANPGKPRFVAGSCGPSNKTCSLSPDVENPAYRAVTFDALSQAYEEQVNALIDGGVDLLLFETCYDTLNAKAGLYAAEKVLEERGLDLPVMLSVTVADIAGRTLSGQTIEAFLTSVEGFRLFSIGLNCSFGASRLKPFLRVLRQRAPFYISCHPNAGLPNSLGEYEQTPEMMQAEIREFLDEGLVNIVGGCCGTTDDYIRDIARVAASGMPPVPVERRNTLQISGLEAFEKSPAVKFINVGERCNVAGSRKFLRLIRDKQYEEALSLARKQVEDGAMVLDINMDDGLLDTRAEMVHFLNLIASEPEIAKVPLMIDSSRWDVILAGLKCVQGKCIVNSISLKEGEELFLEKARQIQRLGAAVVVMAFDEEGQATTYERRIQVCERAYRLLVDTVHFNPNDIIFDPNVLAVATGLPEHDAYALDFIRATQWITQHLPGAHVSGGISNLSFSFRGNNSLREAMHAVFLYHAVSAGMDMGIVNPSSSVLYSEIDKVLLEKLEDVILNRNAGATEALLQVSEEMMKAQQKDGEAGLSTASGKRASWRTLPVEERLKRALVKGLGEYLETDLHVCLEMSEYVNPLKIIEGPLMDGMRETGVLFGEGKMFLPQVVKSARTMKKAVDILKPYLSAGAARGASSGKVVLATVKGDVHDIGKNIAGLIMTCNGYEVLDLGVMVPAGKIVSTALEEQADAVILSGLITPSLEEMVRVAQMLEAAGYRKPLLVSGATTSPLHTALKIAPVYGGVVVHLKDASQNSLVLSQLLNPAEAETYIPALKEAQARLRANHEKSQPLVSFEEANRNGLKLFD